MNSSFIFLLLIRMYILKYKLRENHEDTQTWFYSSFGIY